MRAHAADAGLQVAVRWGDRHLGERASDSVALMHGVTDCAYWAKLDQTARCVISVNSRFYSAHH